MLRSKQIQNLLIVLGLFCFCLFLTRKPLIIWDTRDQMWLTRWVYEIATFQWLFKAVPRDIQIVTWYGPLWEGATGLLGYGLFGWLRDPVWTKTAANLALLPVTLFSLCFGLRRLGWTFTQSLLSGALLLGCIRFGGHSLFNTKDFPFACAYLVVSVWLIVRLRNSKPTLPWFWGTTYLSLVPLLLRPPVGVHFAFFWAWRVWESYRQKGALEAAKSGALTACAGIAATFTLWPAMWRTSPLEWVRGILMFTRFPMVFDVRFFGVDAYSDRLPGYYPWVWLPVDYTPVAFFVLIVGALLTFPLLYRTRGFLHSDRALAALCVIPGLALMLQKPSLYDEDRHVLFAIVSTALFASIGLRALSSRVQGATVVLLALSSIAAYAHWREYSYVYKSPVIGDISADRFMGDYWGVCVNELLAQVSRSPDRPSHLYAALPTPILEIIRNRAEESRFGADPWIATLPLQPIDAAFRGPIQGHYLGFRRNITGLQAQLERARAGHGDIKAEIKLPSGEAACAWIEFR
jgi:hypothetical protein